MGIVFSVCSVVGLAAPGKNEGPRSGRAVTGRRFDRSAHDHRRVGTTQQVHEPLHIDTLRCNLRLRTASDCCRSRGRAFVRISRRTGLMGTVRFLPRSSRYGDTASSSPRDVAASGANQCRFPYVLESSPRASCTSLRRGILIATNRCRPYIEFVWNRWKPAVFQTAADGIPQSCAKCAGQKTKNKKQIHSRQSSFSRSLVR